MKKIFIPALIFSSGFLFAQEINKPALDSLFNYLNREKIGNGSVSIFYDGKPIYSNAYGKSSVEKSIFNNPETKFRIGSISKTFTATIVLKLIEENKLSLDTKLAKFYPEVKNSDKITIKNLLQHSSGISNITNDESYTSWYTKPINKKDLLKIINGYSSDFEPNSKNKYSNSNYILLGFIIEDVTKKSYADILNQYITKPLNLTNTKVGGKIFDDKNEANSYNYSNNEYKLEPETDMSVPIGAGNLVSTASDLNRFFYELLNGKILNSKSLEQMKTFSGIYGLGLFDFTINQYKGVGHDGGIDQFTSINFSPIEEKYTYTVLQNSNELNTSDVLVNLLNATHKSEIKYPKKVVSINLSNEDLKKYEGEYSSTEIPPIIKVFIENGVLNAQASGQGSFELTATSATEFEFAPANIKMVFDGIKMQLIQGDSTFNFQKK